MSVEHSRSSKTTLSNAIVPSATTVTELSCPLSLVMRSTIQFPTVWSFDSERDGPYPSALTSRGNVPRHVMPQSAGGVPSQICKAGVGKCLRNNRLASTASQHGCVVTDSGSDIS